MLWTTTELGKELVYKHGVDVAAVPIEEEQIDFTGESSTTAIGTGTGGPPSALSLMAVTFTATRTEK